MFAAFVRCGTLCVALMSLGLSAGALRAAESIDLSYVSGDAVAAVVISPSALLMSPKLEMLPIEVIVAAGKQHLGIDPMNIEQMIGTVGIAGLASGEPSVGAICRFADPYDPAAMAAKVAQFTEKAGYRGKTYYRSKQPNGPCFCSPDNTTLLIGNEAAIKAMLSATNSSTPLKKLLQKADTTKAVTAVVDFATLRPLVMIGVQNVPPVPAPYDQFMKVPELVSWVEATYDIELGLGLGLTIGANDGAAAAELNKLVERAKGMARQYITAQFQGAMVPANDPTQQALVDYMQRISNTMIDSIAFEVDEDRLRMLPIQGSQSLTSVYMMSMMVGLTLPAVQSAREAARRAQSTNNLKQIGLALHNYADANKRFPARAIRDKEGKPLLSWRVSILPYVEGGALFEEFHLDEPWDSEHNKKLIARMPPVFSNPNLDASEGKTVYLAVNGEETAFGGKEGKALREITDGLSNTIIVVEVDADHAVEWTRPDDLDFDPQNPTNGLGNLRPGGWNALFCDGSVRFMSNGFDKSLLGAMMTCAGGEVVPNDR